MAGTVVPTSQLRRRQVERADGLPRGQLSLWWKRPAAIADAVVHQQTRNNWENNPKKFDEANISQTWFEIKRNIIFDVLIKKIEPKLREYLKSPFSVVNINAWKTKSEMKVMYDSDGNPRGPNRIHNDGYPPGHYKCIIYLKPLNEEFGKLQIEDKIIESEKPGCAIVFNQNLYHQALTNFGLTIPQVRAFSPFCFIMS